VSSSLTPYGKPAQDYTMPFKLVVVENTGQKTN